MALNNQTITAVLAAIASDGQAAVTAQIQTAFVTQAVGATTAALAPAVAMEVTDWAVVESVLAAGTPSQTLMPLRDAIAAKVAAQDDSNLGVLLLMLYAATRSHFG